MPKKAGRRQTKKRSAERPRGQIIPRGPRTFLVRVPLEAEEGTKKRKYNNRTVHGTRADAEKVRTEMLREVDAGLVKTPPSQMTLEAYLTEWLAAKVSVRARTRRTYEAIAHAYVIPHLGNRKLRDLTPKDIQGLYAKLLGQIGPSTIRHTHQVLRQSLADAVELFEYIPKSPVTRALELPALEEREYTVFNREQVSTFLSAVPTLSERFAKMYPLWLLLLSSGLRPQEALALQWRDLHEGALLVRRTIEEPRTGTFAVRHGMKTKRSARRITLGATTVEVLERHKAAEGERARKEGAVFTPETWMFTERFTSFRNPISVRRTWNDTLAALQSQGLDIPTIRLYDTRHTHATLLLLADVHPKKVQERLGHANIQMTLNRYSHVLKEMESDAADATEELFFTPRLKVDAHRFQIRSTLN